MRFSSSTWLRTRTYIDACMPLVMAWPTAPPAPVRCRYAARQSHPAVTKKVRTNLFSGFRPPSLAVFLPRWMRLAGWLAGFPATIWHAEQQRRNVVVVRGGGRRGAPSSGIRRGSRITFSLARGRARSEGGRRGNQRVSCISIALFISLNFDGGGGNGDAGVVGGFIDCRRTGGRTEEGAAQRARQWTNRWFQLN